MTEAAVERARTARDEMYVSAAQKPQRKMLRFVPRIS
jgi:hypothetical protein